jgi:hypothetical protein
MERQADACICGFFVQVVYRYGIKQLYEQNRISLNIDVNPLSSRFSNVYSYPETHNYSPSFDTIPQVLMTDFRYGCSNLR